MEVLFSIANNVGTITLNRPDAYNSVNAAMAKAWIDALDKCKEEDVRCVVITGIGKAFCAGQDLKEATDPELMPGFEVLLRDHYEPIVRRIVSLQKPVIAAVNGVAAGAGANLALCCDIVIAASSASFVQAFSNIGLVPDSGGTYHLPRLVGRAKAMAYMLLGEKITASEAERHGMIYKCIDDAHFEGNIIEMAQKLALMPTAALALTKKMVNNSWSNDLDDQLKLESENQLAACHTEDYQEGVLSFLEKRKPLFKGK